MGCSQGIVPLLLAREGCQVTGVDTSPQAIEEAKGYLSAEPAHIQQNVTYINSDFLALDTLEVEPDTVVISEVLEHLVRPELFVEKAYDLLKQGGRLVITVPFGVNDFIDHKHTFYLMEPFRLLAEHLQIIEVKMLGKWLGIVAVKNEAHKPGTIDSLTVDRVRELEKAFESIERTLRGNLGDIGKRLEEANKKYRSATEQIAQLRPEAQKAEALAKQLQTRDTDIATLQQANREILDAKAKRVQELEEIKERLDDANRKYRLATEQLSLLKPEAQKVEALTRQLQDRDAHIVSLEQTNQEALEASARSIQELNAELDSLKFQLGEANEKCLATAEQYAQLQQQIAVLEEAQGQRDQELDSLQQSLLSLEEQLLATDQQRAAAEALAANESTKIEALQAQHDALESQLLQVTELQAKGQADNAALNETVSSLQKQRNELESQLEVLSEQLVQAQQLNDGHIETITMLRAQQAALQAKLENQRQAADELQSQAEQTNAGHVDTITALRAQQAALQAALENQQQALASTQAKADESNAAHESTIAALQAQQVELQAELERRAELQTHAEQTNTGHIETITALRAHQAALEAELEGQAQAMTELREQAGLADTARLETISSLQSRVEELDALLGTAVESRDKTLEANTDHINTIASLRELQTAMETALENQKQALSILQTESSQDIAEKDECIATLRKRQAELEAELESELEYMNELQAQTQRADAAQAETIALLKARQAELEADLGNQRQAMKQAYAAQAETVTALQNRQTELESQLLEMSETQARGEREHAAQANTINTLVELRNGFEEQVHALTQANAQAQEALAEQAETIASLTQAKDALVEQLMLETASRQAAEASLAATNEQWQGLRMQLENELNSSKAGLGAANLKYRTVSTEQIPQLKANLNQLLERSAAQQRKIDELNANLERANTQRHLAEQRLIKTRTSMTYQLGYQIKNSANSLGGLVRLPVRLLRLYRKANQQRQQNEQKRIANEPMKALLPLRRSFRMRTT